METPTIWGLSNSQIVLQEGCRYNALHVAAMAKNAEICELVLRTVSDVAFMQLLYGEDDVVSCRDRADILLDLYLNTPCKGMNETPLHFAVKFGAVSVVETLLSYPQCDKYVRNKQGETPKQASYTLHNRNFRTSVLSFPRGRSS